MTTAFVHTEDADIVFDAEGTGPLLLTIAGGGGDAARYAPLARMLSDTYTVVRYDRRGNARSTGDPKPALDLAQQARDAVAVIRAMGAHRAYIFGNSSGANIGLKLAEDVPDVIAGLIAHEPPVLSILPDAPTWIDFVEKVHETYTREGTQPAMKLFSSSLVGFDAPTQWPSVEYGAGPNMEYFLAREIVPISAYEPDLDAISWNHVSIVMAAGHRSADAFYARTARLLAQPLGCRYVEFPGNHLAFLNEAEAFATALHKILVDLAHI